MVEINKLYVHIKDEHHYYFFYKEDKLKMYYYMLDSENFYIEKDHLLKETTWLENLKEAPKKSLRLFIKIAFMGKK